MRGKVVVAAVVLFIIGILVGIIYVPAGIALFFMATVLLLVGVLVMRPKSLPAPQAFYYPPPPPYYPPPSAYPPPPQPQVVQQREVVTREIIKVRCRNCGALADAGVNNCPSCGAPMR